VKEKVREIGESLYLKERERNEIVCVCVCVKCVCE
jgi:hypothetical protein